MCFSSEEITSLLLSLTLQGHGRLGEAITGKKRVIFNHPTHLHHLHHPAHFARRIIIRDGFANHGGDAKPVKQDLK
jgi:hypothetical protein